jgi:hypothetical protein
MSLPPDREDRLEKQYRRLGTREPLCVGCAESNPFCLELHHLAGQKYHGDLAIVCRNCHRKLTDQQQEHEGSLSPKPWADSVTIGRYLLGLADLLLMVVNALRDFGKHLIGRRT